MNEHLSRQGLSLRGGMIVDATIIAAPISTKNVDGKRAPSMQTKKGNQWHFGMKAHIGVDEELWLDASRHVHSGERGRRALDARVAAWQGSPGIGDSGYTGADKRECMAKRQSN